jgi:Rad3-related DNA helicase
MLAFFPSYTLLDQMVSRWKSTSIYTNLSDVAGVIVVETKAKVSKPKQQLGSAKDIVRKPLHLDEDNGSDDEAEAVASDVVSEFNKALDKYGKCLLLAVCRGKVSEGIDFKDNRARAVMIVGIPYAPYKDPWVVLKQKYLDEKVKEASALPSTTQQHSHLLPYSHFTSQRPVLNTVQPVAVSKISGREWYNQSAIRAVNQAIGRIIRHKRDWGGVFLLDERCVL